MFSKYLLLFMLCCACRGYAQQTDSTSNLGSDIHVMRNKGAMLMNVQDYEVVVESRKGRIAKQVLIAKFPSFRFKQFTKLTADTLQNVAVFRMCRRILHPIEPNLYNVCLFAYIDTSKTICISITGERKPSRSLEEALIQLIVKEGIPDSLINKWPLPKPLFNRKLVPYGRYYTWQPELALQPIEREPTVLRRHAVIVNFPSYVQCGGFPGWSAGLEYQALINKKRQLYAALSVTRLIWAGTPETGEDYARGQRANIKANLVGPSLYYKPFAAQTQGSVEFGIIALVGSIKRLESYHSRMNGAYSSTYEQAFFFAPQVHFGICMYSRRRRTIVSFYGDFGPIVSADALTKGNFGLVGMKVGGLF